MFTALTVSSSSAPGSTLPWLLASFIAAGLVKGVTGMGLPTVAMGLLGSVMGAPAAAALLLVPSAVTNLWQLFAGPALRPLLRRLGTLVLGICVGTVAGSAWLVQVDARWSSLALGTALVVYAGYSMLAPPLTVPPRWEAWLSPLVGLLTGVITGVTGVFVMPAVPYLQALRLDKEALVQALGLSFTVSTAALAAGLATHDALQPAQLTLSTLAVAPALLGMWLGQRLRHRISPRAFLVCFRVFLLLLGLSMVWRVV
ncbi:hypothetical protein CCO03_00180 [Comamonas serinivorans]|uniref:Probable membrane transporter protein n=1 Tax=Comamonas serinivorans TaxID=1082851 RepID=A0A1Y0ES88_9BURK|nr:sulfite exporter TauE/SafE family protein [Comamonas serinivorans]ARU06534.1 hypothetical protein CCO03_00180 [Comamonas serinivorans]